MKVPSGEIFNENDIELLKLMAKYGFVSWSEKPFKLKSGIMSHVYVFGREDLTDHPELLVAVGRKISERVHKMMKAANDKRQPCLIGIPIAGIPLATAAALFDAINSKNPSQSICYRIMRQKLKAHGAHHNWIDGRPDFEKHRYIGIDNVITDGGSKIEAAENFENDGYPAKDLDQIIFIDREQGGPQLLVEKGFKKPEIIFKLLDITFVYKELGLWSPESIKKVEDEIAAHQFGQNDHR
ncbi:MAG TPA: hypothetical protein VK675_01305 [Candidatus Paceibacterota bacterium]|nr:hypothetical protein [Candidatus Paceibacterota bacterium]